MRKHRDRGWEAMVEEEGSNAFLEHEVVERLWTQTMRVDGIFMIEDTWWTDLDWLVANRERDLGKVGGKRGFP